MIQTLKVYGMQLPFNLQKNKNPTYRSVPRCTQGLWDLKLTQYHAEKLTQYYAKKLTQYHAK